MERSSRVVTTFMRLAVYACLLIAWVGCQKKPTIVSGAVTMDGAPLKVPANARGTVVFQPDGGSGTMATGLLDPTGHFNLATGSSSEVAEGKYYVTVSVSQLLPKTDGEEQGTKFITPSKYASARDSGLTANVKSGVNQVSFNLVSEKDDLNTSPADDPSTKK